MRKIQVRIFRGAETGNGQYQTYTVETEENTNVSVMNLLEVIYAKQDHSLAFFSHAACRQAACGRCMVKVNGAVKLACKEQVNDDTVTLEPYSNKVIRDLVCEV